MSERAADSSSAWDATERSRAQTRALLTALSRDHHERFHRPLIQTLVASLITLGIWPLWDFRATRGRWQRMWLRSLREFSVWVSEFVDLELGNRLLRELSRREPSPSRRPFISTVFGIVGISAALVMLATNVQAWDDVRRWSSPSHIALAFGGLSIAFAWTLETAYARRASQILASWVELLNAELLQHNCRPIDRTTHASVWPYVENVTTCIALLAILPLPAWITAPLFYAHQWNAELTATRALHLQLIERLLEWMDNSGLPVEYDVTALNPDEIAAMIG